MTVPLRNVRGDLKTLQFILAKPTDDGKDKLLLKDGEKQGAFCHRHLVACAGSVAVRGYATGASLHEHTGLPVAVCIDAGNLELVALAIRGTYPRLRLLICGDHDAFKAGGNTGQEKAKAAAYALTGGAGWCVPDFLAPCDAEVLEDAGLDPSKAQRKAALTSLRQRDSQRYEVEKPTDFNDLAAWFNGADRVKAQIDAALVRIGLIEVRSGDMPRVVRQAEAELIFGGGVYQRSGNLVRVVRHDFRAGMDAQGMGCRWVRCGCARSPRLVDGAVRHGIELEAMARAGASLEIDRSPLSSTPPPISRKWASGGHRC
ncbi:MAG: toprim domain-containing protein [Dokdonella sp.]|nr:toprim domain-containing protein [Dokdonella sp.]